MIVWLAGRQLHVILDEQARVVALGNLRKRHPDAQRIERLALTFEQQRIEGDTLYLGVVGFSDLATVIAAHAKSTQAAIDRLREYFPGDMHFNEMLRATIRAYVPGATEAIGDERYYLSRALEQRRAHQSPHLRSPIGDIRH